VCPTVLIPLGLALVVAGLVRSGALAVAAATDLRVVASLSLVAGLGLVALGGGLGWMGLRSVRHFFAVVDARTR
jgi:hypothetical protein